MRFKCVCKCAGDASNWVAMLVSYVCLSVSPQKLLQAINFTEGFGLI